MIKLSLFPLRQSQKAFVLTKTQHGIQMFKILKGAYAILYLFVSVPVWDRDAYLTSFWYGRILSANHAFRFCSKCFEGKNISFATCIRIIKN